MSKASNLINNINEMYQGFSNKETYDIILILNNDKNFHNKHIKDRVKIWDETEVKKVVTDYFKNNTHYGLKVGSLDKVNFKDIADDWNENFDVKS